jgi:hypothetical protein
MADVAEDDASFEKPRWFTPRRLLLIFCITNLVVYLDRGKMCISCCACCRLTYACNKAHTTATTFYQKLCITYRCYCKQWSEWITKNGAATPGLWHTGVCGSSSSSSSGKKQAAAAAATWQMLTVLNDRHNAFSFTLFSLK